MEKIDKGSTFVKGKVLPVYHASPLERAKLAKNDIEKLALFNKPDILRFFLHLEDHKGRS